MSYYAFAVVIFFELAFVKFEKRNRHCTRGIMLKRAINDAWATLL